MPKYGIPFERKPLDLETIFGRSAPRFLEIGFGMGETTAAIARESPGMIISRLKFTHLELEVLKQIGEFNNECTHYPA